MQHAGCRAIPGCYPHTHHASLPFGGMACCCTLACGLHLPGVCLRMHACMLQGGYVILTNHRLLWIDTAASPAPGRSCHLHLACVHAAHKRTQLGLPVKVRMGLPVKVHVYARAPCVCVGGGWGGGGEGMQHAPARQVCMS